MHGFKPLMLLKPLRGCKEDTPKQDSKDSFSILVQPSMLTKFTRHGASDMENKTLTYSSAAEPATTASKSSSSCKLLSPAMPWSGVAAHT
jgi:hypothetical protein